MKTDAQNESLTHIALRSLKWSLFAEIATKAIGPLVFLVLAKILLPEDFGIVAAATVVISFSQTFWEAGLAKALIHKQTRSEESANAVFWLNIGLSIAMFLALLLLASPIAVFFHDARIAAVVKVLALQLPLAALASVHTALFQKDFQFKKLFWIRLITTSAPAMASLPLAMMGSGHWALVAGTMTGQVAQTIALWRLSPWQPSLTFDKTLAMELWRFGRWAMLSSLLGWFYVWMDAIIVGHYLGPHDMGLYRAGNTFVTMIFGLIFTPILPVLYSVFSRTQFDLPKLRENLLFTVKGIALLAFPISIGLAVSCHPIEQLIFGPKWIGIGYVVKILAVAHGLSWTVGANGEAYRAMGKPHLETWAMAMSISIYSIGYLIAVKHGLKIFVLTRLLLVFIGIASHLLFSCKYLKITVRNYIGTLFYTSISVFIMMLSVNIAILYGGNFSTNNLFILTVGLISYTATISYLESSFIKKLLKLIKENIL